MSAVTGLALAGWIAATRGGGALRTELNGRAIAAGIGTFAAYACVLFALRLASAASVAAVRESGVLVATVLAAVFLRERVTAPRAGGAALVVAGVALLSL
jgi:drug/metabolite transporter (DMT)-like permease